MLGAVSERTQVKAAVLFGEGNFFSLNSLSKYHGWFPLSEGACVYTHVCVYIRWQKVVNQHIFSFPKLKLFFNDIVFIHSKRKSRKKVYQQLYPWFQASKLTTLSLSFLGCKMGSYDSLKPLGVLMLCNSDSIIQGMNCSIGIMPSLFLITI